ncbi:hypothetical protein B566_EDAN001464 [Ephemera danica]|nr:hypothetical protein B566_EDAN001464 [Ephemera danica]
MSSSVHAASTYTAGSNVDPAFYYRAFEPQAYYTPGSWSQSPGSSGRSVSPCDEYQPPDFQQQQPECSQLHQGVQPYGRVTKRRTTANKKERRRTQSINNAFADLRDCIPNVPSDTKLSKIKTLRLATSYIAYLMGVLADEEAGSFRADLLPRRASSHRHVQQQQHHQQHQQQHEVHHDQVAAEHARRCNELAAAVAAERKSKGRTGWPQHVWALELKP